MTPCRTLWWSWWHARSLDPTMVDLALIPIVTAVYAGALAYACTDAVQGSSRGFWVFFAVLAVLAVASLARMFRDGTLLDLFRWRQGDVFFGAVLAAALGVCLYVGRGALAPKDSPAQAWLLRLYLQLPPPASGTLCAFGQSLAFFAVGAMDEIVWRGAQQQAVEERVGIRRGWLVTTALYGVAHLPTITLFAMPIAGKNPLALLAALLVSIVFGFLVGRLQRLPPALIGHGLLSYLMATQLRPWG